MESDGTPVGVAKGDHYRHADDTTEVVYAVEDGTVLTVREYPSEEAFSWAVDGADYVGVHFGVASLPDVPSPGGSDD